ncbi:hypothetical protein CARUB_v10020821mg [Capsella rubella]|uniref:MRN complex-interacting protein N-terminal domain-containing protein n=1 Tax=Capsella rubella TaxID=81985 RepID=R0GI97_9BRAS|nr:MRN complex-interacting protein [Capsella rubella]EOA35607.1 hypothetical protein CARUB_v10020821mg [Capsella rubella]
MASTLFIALQCFECSTMQVKQKKKSSNKWVCVICNQKQSVKKVFAQGYKAKDLRRFVQSFNMSRKASDDKALSFVDSCSEVDVREEVDEEEVSDACGKKRSDWSEYLDFDLPNDDRRLSGVEDDVKIVTEMPTNMFKRPKLNKYSTPGAPSSETGDGDGIFKPAFSIRNIEKPDFCSDAVVMRKENIEQRSLESELERVTKPASKWDAYLINDKIEHQAPPRFGGKKALKDVDVEDWDSAITEMSSEHQIVDEEVHPDFM